MSNPPVSETAVVPSNLAARSSLSCVSSAKLRPHHQDRLAMVFVRQSTARQVAENRESRELQYAFVQRALDLGWPRSRIEVIDEDQAHSGATSEGRPGFQRLLAEVSLNHVGLILGREMSRVARSCKDWHNVFEVCGVFQTLLGDLDGVYDPSDYNDRLLLGLKGIMSEAELHVLKSRMHAGRVNKARRGELLVHPPIGYLKLPTGEFIIDPDEQVQEVVRLIFDQFDRLGSIRQVFRYLVKNGIQIGYRPHTGPNRGQLEWRRPARSTIQNLLKHPIYAGYYRFGQHATDPRKRKPGHPHSGRVNGSEETGLILLPDRLPAYITKERYQANQACLAANRARLQAMGAPRNGCSLLAGLVYCARCGHRMMVHYCGTKKWLRYTCHSADYLGTSASCPGMVGDALDRLVAEQVLAALQPAALELSLAAAENLQQERERLDRHWRQRLERARYEMQRAERQYQAVEPENRLVARELERRWEESMQGLRQLEKEHERFQQAQPVGPTAQDRTAILELAKDLPLVWHASTTTSADRQRIIRQVVTRVRVLVDRASERVTAHLEWFGGSTTSHEFARSLVKYEDRSDFGRLLKRLTELVKAGKSFVQIADMLHEEGFRGIFSGRRIQDSTVLMLYRRHVAEHMEKTLKRARYGLDKHEWWASALTLRLRIARTTMQRWLKAGYLHHRYLPGNTKRRRRIVCWADRDELRRLGRLRAARRNGSETSPLEDLTTPKPKPSV